MGGEFAGDENELAQYFETAYVGRSRPNGGPRRNPLFPTPSWNVYERRHRGRTRTNNSVEAFHNAMSSSLVRASRSSMCKLIESLKSQQNLTDVNMASIARGDTKRETPKQLLRNQRIETLITRYEEDADALKMLRGIAYNYM